MKTKIYYILLFCCIAVLSHAKKQIKVACVGNSITYGAGTANPEKDSYPSQLQRMLGNNYLVGNFGKSGATLLYKGHRPYIEQAEYKKAIDFKADLVILHLGVNDTDPRNWPNYRDFFITDYRALIDSFRYCNPKCRILIARITPISDRHRRFESGTRDWHHEIQTAIEQVAKYTGVQLIDFHEPLYHYPSLLPDGIHPNEQGAKILAKTVYSSITGDFGGLKMSPLYSDNMILQHNCPLVIRGKANAHEKITVEIAQQKVVASASSDGNWQVTLKDLKAGGPYVLSVAAGKQKLTYNNVLAGEVWLCSGQSNMEFHLNWSTTGARDIPQASNHNIRLFNMKARWLTHAIEWDSAATAELNKLQYFENTSWVSCSPQTASNFSAIAYYFGKKLQDSLQIPIGLICNAVGGAPAESWVDRKTLEDQIPAILRNWTQNDFIQDWVRERARLNIKKSKNKLQRHPYEPCYLFEAGIRPLEQFPIKGVIWYQGESNAHNYEVHEKLFQLLVQSWRKNWNNESLPFYYVQLSSLNRPSWPWFRDSQRRLLDKIPHSGMAVSSDKGDSLDVHPKQKLEIGERLAWWALNKTYNKKAVVPSGPLYKGITVVGNKALITFDYAMGMHSLGNAPLCGFEVAGTDGVFYPAQAILANELVEVWSDKVKSPKIVRYGWQPFTRANLVNSSQLPASTFRSDL